MTDISTSKQNLNNTYTGKSTIMDLGLTSKTVNTSHRNEDYFKSMRKQTKVLLTKQRHTTLLPQHVSENNNNQEEINLEKNIENFHTEESEIIRRMTKRQKIVIFFNSSQ